LGAHAEQRKTHGQGRGAQSGVVFTHSNAPDTKACST
jgi:hypothetical protein